MPFFQILDCSSELGTCCSNYGLATILDAFRKIMNLLQIVAPILLIFMAVVGFAQIVMNPEKKGGVKSVVNKFVAAIFIFFMPIIMDALLLLLPETFSVSACWEKAKVMSEVSQSTAYHYANLYEDDDVTPIIVDPNDYNASKPASSGSNNGSNGSSQKGQDIVNYAKKFVGKPYVWGGTWNGEEPYTGTDCSGFVQGVFRHNGILLSRTTYSQWADTGTYTVVNSSDIKAGDLVMYNGHVAILTGNGNEIIHAKGSNYGITIDSDYTASSSRTILGIMRINGVN